MTVTVLSPLNRGMVVPAGQQADVVDLRNPPGKQLDRACGEVPLVVVAKRRVVRAIELMHVARLGVGVGQDAVDVPALCSDALGQAGHLDRRQDPVKIRAHRNAVMAIKVCELPVRR